MGKETKLSLLKTRIHVSQYLTIFGTNLKWNGLHYCHFTPNKRFYFSLKKLKNKKNSKPYFSTI